MLHVPGQIGPGFDVAMISYNAQDTDLFSKWRQRAKEGIENRP